MGTCVLEFFLSSLNPLGLILNIAGVALAFFYGYPQPDLDDTIRLSIGEVADDFILPSGETRREQKERIARKKRRHYFRSRLGLTLMLFGFIAQLGAIYVPK